MAAAMVLCAASAAWAGTEADRPAGAAVGLENHKPGESFDLGDRKVKLEKLEVVPYLANEFSSRYVYDTYENPKLKELRTQYGLEAVVAPGKDEFAKQVLLLDWAHGQIDFGDPHEMTTMRNAQEILRLTRKEHKFYCTHYAAVFMSAANSLGYVVRSLGIPAHCFNEIWSNQFRKWVMFDATANLYVEKDGLPLNTYEVRQEWFAHGGKGLTCVIGGRRQKALSQSFGGYYILEYFPNTNWMDAPRDTDHMFTTVDAWSKGQEGHHRDHPQDPAVEPYFPINQAAFTLTPSGDDLQVTLKTITPNFATFQVRLDGRDWADSKEAFTWQLHEGRNSLEARSVNKFGVGGPESSVVLSVAAPGTSPSPTAAASQAGNRATQVAADGGPGRLQGKEEKEEAQTPAYVHFWSTRGHWLEWTIEGAEAGSYTIVWRYGAKFRTEREVRFNGQAVKELAAVQLAPTGGWLTFKELTLPAKVTLQAGRNLLRITCLDEVSVALGEIRLSSPGRKDLVIPAGSFTSQGGGQVQATVSAQGGYFTMWDEAGHWLEWTVEAPAAGRYDLYLRYAALSPTDRQLLVNGEAVPGLESFPLETSGGWRFWIERQLPAAITLQAGRNVLRLVNAKGTSLNLSGLRLVGPGHQEIYIRAVEFSRQEGGEVKVVKEKLRN
jgi:hypothetical protein